MKIVNNLLKESCVEFLMLFLILCQIDPTICYDLIRYSIFTSSCPKSLHYITTPPRTAGIHAGPMEDAVL